MALLIQYLSVKDLKRRKELIRITIFQIMSEEKADSSLSFLLMQEICLSLLWRSLRVTVVKKIICRCSSKNLALWLTLKDLSMRFLDPTLIQPKAMTCSTLIKKEIAVVSTTTIVWLISLRLQPEDQIRNKRWLRKMPRCSQCQIFDQSIRPRSKVLNIVCSKTVILSQISRRK